MVFVIFVLVCIENSHALLYNFIFAFYYDFYSPAP